MTVAFGHIRESTESLHPLKWNTVSSIDIAFVTLLVTYGILEDKNKIVDPLALTIFFLFS